MGFLLWIGIPLFVGGVIFLSFGGDDGPSPSVRLLVTDHDDAFVSRLLVGAFEQGPLGDLFEVEEVTEEVGRARIEANDAGGLVVIPKGFSTAVLREEPTTVTVLSNPTQQIGPEIVEETLTMASDVVFYLHRLLGDDVRAVASPDTLDTATFDAISVRIGTIGRFLGESLSEPPIRLTERVDPADTSEGLDIGALFLPGILFMALLFMAQGTSEDLWREYDQRTLSRFLTTPGHLTGFLLGKALAVAVLMAIATGVTLIAAAAGFGVPARVFPGAILWSLLAGLMLTAGFFILQGLATSQRAGSVLAMTVVFPLMMLGGSFFPFEAMPAWMASIGGLTPNGWALGVLKDILFERGTTAELLRATGTGVALTALSFIAGTLVVRRRFTGGA